MESAADGRVIFGWRDGQFVRVEECSQIPRTVAVYAKHHVGMQQLNRAKRRPRMD
jgi:hypothetical protein